MLAVLCAMRQELVPIMAHMHVSKKFNVNETLLCQADMDGLPVTLVQTGIGRKNAIEATNHLLQSFKIKLLISYGVAGGLKPGINVGDLVIAENVGYSKQSDFEGEDLQIESSFSCKDDFVELAKQLSSKSEAVSHCGDLLTVDRVIGQAKTKEKIGMQSPFLAVDMESAAVAEVAHERGIEFAALRSVSDSIEDTIQIDENIISDEGKIKFSKLALNVMKDPRKLALLRRLNKQTKIASRNLSLFATQLIPLLYDKALV